MVWAGLWRSRRHQGAWTHVLACANCLPTSVIEVPYTSRIQSPVGVQQERAYEAVWREARGL